MISVLLTVLKIIGITVLVILGFILFILLLVLFVPISYTANGSYRDNSAAVQVRVTWLLHAVSARAAYCRGQALHLYLKLFGIPVYDNLNPGSRKTGNKKTKSTKTKPVQTGEIRAASVDNRAPDIQNEKMSVAPVPDSQEDASGHVLLTDNEMDEQKPESGIFQKINRFFSKFVDIFKNIKFTFHKIYDTIVRIKDNIKYYLEILQLDSTKQAFSACRKQLERIIKKTVPRKYRIKFHLGFDDPSVMGEVLAVWGMLYPLHQGSIDIEPEFGTSVVEGDFSLKGRISVSVFAWAACMLFFDKNVKLLIKRIKRNI